MHSVTELKHSALGNLLGNYRIPIKAMILASLIPSLIELPFSYLIDGTSGTLLQTGIYYLVEFLISVIGSVLVCGEYLIHMEMVRKETYRDKDLFYCFRHASDHYFTGIIVRFLLWAPAYFLFWGSSYVVMANLQQIRHKDFSCLPLAAGLIAAAAVLACLAGLLSTFFFHVLLDDEENSIRLVFGRSLFLLTKHFGRVFRFYLSFLGMKLLVLLSFGLASLWVRPYYMQSLTLLYQDIKDTTN